jgi:hypothetical protein
LVSGKFGYFNTTQIASQSFEKLTGERSGLLVLGIPVRLAERLEFGQALGVVSGKIDLRWPFAGLIDGLHQLFEEPEGVLAKALHLGPFEALGQPPGLADQVRPRPAGGAASCGR